MNITKDSTNQKEVEQVLQTARLASNDLERITVGQSAPGQKRNSGWL
jgi:hypothetical protein